MLHLQIGKSLPGFRLQVSLDAPEESVTVLFGPSGAGKSMTLAAIAGFVTPDAGVISIGDRVLFSSAGGINLAPQQRRIGLVKQDLALFPHLTVAQNVAYGLFGEARAVAQQRVRDLLAIMNLADMADRRPAELSGGQQQRVALARALAIQPSLLLLDEPFSALDWTLRVQLRQELKTLQRRLSTTMLFVTHDVAEAYILADNLAVIDQGAILQSGAPDAVLSRPDTRRVAEVAGASNILPGIVVAAGQVRIGDCHLVAPTQSFAAGDRIYAMIRPERVNLVREDRAAPASQNVLEGDIIDARSDGSNVDLLFRLAPPRLLPDSLFDLRIAVPVYIYERLDLAHKRHWQIAVKPNQIHVVR
jgi:ABC-type sulfate/molybdate transport systems ATPase subunit